MGTPSPSFLELFEPIGMRLMDSTPQAIATSTTPPATRAVARLVACWDDPHWVSTVVAATDIGRPAASHAVRVVLNDCSPTWLTHPPTTWPTSAGSIPERVTSSARVAASRSDGCTVDSPPLRRPMGVRTASMITTSFMAASYGCDGAASCCASARKSARSCRGGIAVGGLQTLRSAAGGLGSHRELVVAPGQARAPRAGRRAGWQPGAPPAPWTIPRGPHAWSRHRGDRRGCVVPALRSSGRVAESWTQYAEGV